MNPNWKQPTPTDQLVSLVNALAGEIDNRADPELKTITETLTEQILQLVPFLQKPETWTP